MKRKAIPASALIYIVIAISILGIDFSCLVISQSPFGIDYADFYTAGRMVIDGNIDLIYSMKAHHAALEQLFGNISYLLEWIYPPTFLLPIVPLAYLPYAPSLAVWLALSFVPVALAVYLLSGKNKLAPLIFLTFPATFLNIRWGQNGFLTAALFAFGVYFVETNPLLAGLAFGLLTFKPQMAIIPFFLLLLLRKWKAFGWSAAFAAALAVLSGVIFGYQTWVDFFSTSFYNASMLGASWEGTNWGIPTLSTSLRCMGLNGWPLHAILIAVAGAAIYACVRVWKSTQNLSLRLMSLVLCTFLSFPYISMYDFAIFGVPFTLLFLERRKYPDASFHPLMLGLLWLLPLISLIVFLLIKIQICPFLMMAYMLAVVRKADLQPNKQTLPQIV